MCLLSTTLSTDFSIMLDFEIDKEQTKTMCSLCQLSSKGKISCKLTDTEVSPDLMVQMMRGPFSVMPPFVFQRFYMNGKHTQLIFPQF